MARSRRRITNLVLRVAFREQGAAIVEYGLLVAFIAMVALAAVTFFGGSVATLWTDNANSIIDP